MKIGYKHVRISATELLLLLLPCYPKASNDERKNNECEAKDKSVLYVNISGHHKDHLHSVQATEWQIYYGVWLVLFASLYFLIVFTHLFLADITQFLIHVKISQIHLQVYRREFFIGLTAVFYFMIWFYYFRLFYPKNYQTICEQRDLFEFYRDCAIAEANGMGSKAPKRTKSSKSYKNSKVYLGKLFIVTSFMIFCVLVSLLRSFSEPPASPRLDTPFSPRQVERPPIPLANRSNA